MTYRLPKSNYNWDLHSCVRSRPYKYSLTGIDAEKDLFPRNMTGYFDAPEISLLPLGSQKKLLAYHLADFLDYTVTLEHTIVNPALQSMVASPFFEKLPSKMKTQACQMYTDEGYHAYFSHCMAAEARQAFSLYLPTSEPLRIRRLSQFLPSSSKLPLPQELLSFLKAFASETLISKELSAVQSTLVSAPVSNMLRDHTLDEARHCLFFCEVFSNLHHTLNLTPMISTILDLLDIFFETDKDHLAGRLRLVGVNEGNIPSLVDSASENLKSLKKERCTTPVRLFKKLGMAPSVEGLLLARGFI